MSNSPRNREEFLYSILNTALKYSTELLAKHGIVPPWGVAFQAPDLTPLAVYPGVGAGDADFSEILPAVVARLREILKSHPDLPAAAVICTVERGEDKGLMMQFDLPEGSYTFFVPYEKGPSGWNLGKPAPLGERMMPSIYAAQEASSPQ